MNLNMNFKKGVAQGKSNGIILGEQYESVAVSCSVESLPSNPVAGRIRLPASQKF